MPHDKLFGNLAPQNPASLRTTKQQGKSFFKGFFFSSEIKEREKRLSLLDICQYSFFKERHLLTKV